MSTPPARILLIDDDPMIHDAVQMILKPQGYLVESCLTGPSGLEAMRARRPDVVLLDVMLASPSEGFHLVYQMRNDADLKDIPVIILTAVGRTLGLDFAREIGTEYLPVERFLEKPIDAATLREAVRRALDPREVST